MISARVSPDTKASFAALAARHRLSESRLLAKMVHEVIQSTARFRLNRIRSEPPMIWVVAWTWRTASRCDFALGIGCVWQDGPTHGT